MKKTGLNKVLGRPDYRIRQAVNRLPKPPHKELILIRDYTRT